MRHTLPINTKLPETFLDEEDRCGFSISSDMKAVWAVQIDLLERFKEVCRKYGLRYYASSGTLLGAVRHKGYIPWDDDLDVVMFRKDYDKLNEIAEKEFTYPCFFQTIYTDPLHIRGHARLRNSRTTGYARGEKSLPINKGIFIDIFVLDVVPDDPLKCFFHAIRLKFLFTILTYKRFSEDEPRVAISRWIGPFFRDIFFKYVDHMAVYSYYERLCRKYNASFNHTVTKAAFIRPISRRGKYRKEWFEEVHTVPFEFTDIIIQDKFDPVLKQDYGDYMIMRHEATYHGTLTLDPYRAFDEPA